MSNLRRLILISKIISEADYALKNAINEYAREGGSNMPFFEAENQVAIEGLKKALAALTEWRG